VVRPAQRLPGQRSAEDGEVLGEDVDEAIVDRAVAAHHAIAGDGGVFHAEVAATVGDQSVDLDEGLRVEEQIHSLAGRQLAAGVLAFDAIRAAAETRRPQALGELLRAGSVAAGGLVAHRVALSLWVPARDGSRAVSRDGSPAFGDPLMVAHHMRQTPGGPRMATRHRCRGYRASCHSPT
jgi:hypothetical protein